MTHQRQFCAGSLAVLFVALAVLAQPAASQESLTNRHFDANLNGWTVSMGLGSAVWSGDDASGSLTSGSVIVTTTNGAGSGFPVAQCVPILGDEPFTAAAKTRIPSGQSEPGSFRLLVQFFDAPNCDDNDFLSTQAITVLPPPFDSWQPVELEGISPTVSQSAKFILAAYKNAGGTVGPTFEIHADDASLFLGEVHIFVDGFESGNTTAWSATVP